MPELEDLAESGTPIKPTTSSSLLKKYSGKHLLVAFDGGYGSSVGTIGIQLADGEREENLLVLGEYDIGTTSNEAECFACFRAL